MFFLSPVEKDAPPSFLHLQVEGSFSCCITATQATWAGATLFAACEALHAQGCAVQILLTNTASNCHGRHDNIWQYQVPIPINLDIDTMSFLMTHPSIHRIITFSIMEHESEEIRNLFGFHDRGGYGYPSILKCPNVDVLLSYNTLAAQFTNNPEQNLTIAQQVLKILVDSKFERIR
jgi:hypothetical protein